MTRARLRSRAGLTAALVLLTTVGFAQEVQVQWEWVGEQTQTGLGGFSGTIPEGPSGDVAHASGGTSTDSMGNTWVRAGAPGDAGGAGEANWYIDQLARGDSAVVRYAVDRYHLNSEPGTFRRWGKGWLAKHIVVVLAMRAVELGAELSPELRLDLSNLIIDALDEATFRIDGCGVLGNSCVEDFASMMVVAAIARTLFPDVVAIVGDAELERIESRYFELAFTARNGFFSLVLDRSLIDGQEYAMVQNHGEQSAVYSAIALTQLGNALNAYLISGRRIPFFYTADPEILGNLLSVLWWLQSTALSDGSGFVVGCKEYRTGWAISCGDPQFANTVPAFVPGGRVAVMLMGERVFREGYQFRRFEPFGSGGSVSGGRVYQYDLLNPDAINLGVKATRSGKSVVVEWSHSGAAWYDVWGPEGRVGITSGSSFGIDVANWSGRIPFGVVARGSSGLVAGVQLEYLQRHVVRRRLS